MQNSNTPTNSKSTKSLLAHQFKTNQAKNHIKSNHNRLRNQNSSKSRPIISKVQFRNIMNRNSNSKKLNKYKLTATIKLAKNKPALP